MSQRGQQTARVNVDDATWQAFRIRAIQAERSVADELARLVRNDLRRSAPHELNGTARQGHPGGLAGVWRGTTGQQGHIDGTLWSSEAAPG